MTHHLRKLVDVWKHSSIEFKMRVYKLLFVLLVLNGGVWFILALASVRFPILFALAALSYGLGLRHAVDADHIAAIDNTTRKLMNEKKKPVAVGLFFSLGHSTVVLLLTMLLVASSAFVTTYLPRLREIGSVIGVSVSSFFLLLIGLINLIALLDTIKIWRGVLSGTLNHHEEHHHMQSGFLIKIFKPVFSSVKESWHMYPVGFLFGLGFDTASEVALLSISAATAASGMPIVFILLLPLAFTAGMALVDTLDGIVMLGAYGWAYITPLRKLYYNMSITAISVIVAFVIGSIEALQILFAKLHIHGTFPGFISSINIGDLGYIVIGIFLLCWAVSIAIYIYKKYDTFSSPQLR